MQKIFLKNFQYALKCNTYPLKEINKKLLTFKKKNFSVLSNHKNIITDEDKDLFRKELFSSNFANIENVINILNHIPEETDNIINQYLDRDTLERALEIFDTHKNICFKTFQRLERLVHNSFLAHYLNDYLHGKQNFTQIYEFLIHEHVFVVGRLLDILIQNEKFKEAYCILKYFNFSNEINLKKDNKIKLINFLEKNFGKIKSKAKGGSDQNLNFWEIIYLYKNKKELEMNLNENDALAPHNHEHMKLDIHYSNLILINKIENLEEGLKKFEKSDFLGIDCEWKPYSSVIDLKNNRALKNKNQKSFEKNENSNLNKNTKVSTIQIADLENVLVLDIMELEKENNEKFFEIFSKILKNKTFVCHAFHNDIKNFNFKLTEFFRKDCNLIEISQIYKDKIFENTPKEEVKEITPVTILDSSDSLNTNNIQNNTFQKKLPTFHRIGLGQICKVIFNQGLCKVEQCSNWNNRPLRLRQLHYAALDSYILVKLYHLHLNENKLI
jgi:hypothetical protein